MQELHAFTDFPKATDMEEQIIMGTISRVLQTCWDGYKDCINREWDLIPFWLGSVVLDKEATKPFRSFIAPYTMTRYIGYWQSYILLCYRMYKQNDPRMQFTDSQEEFLSRTMMVMSGYTEDKQDALHKVLFELSVSLIRHSDYAKQLSSLIYYAGIRGYNIDYKQWRQPQDYTTILAGLQFCIRVLMLEHTLPIALRDQFTEHSIVTPVDKFRQERRWLIDGGGKCTTLLS